VLMVERSDHILVISMRREAKRNAIDADMTAALSAAFDELDDDPDLRVGILTGTATVFSAGNDLKTGAGMPTPRGGPYGLITRARRKPLIAAVEGFALGGGFELVLASDLVVASTDAAFGLPEVTRGVLALYGGLFRTARTLPWNIARELVLTGATLSAERAYGLGLVNRLVEPSRALESATELARTISANAPVAVQESLRVMNELPAAAEAAAWDAVLRARETVWATDDMREGIEAFKQRREPRWSGH
jgi:enoyl-CoA hydratase